MWQCWQQDPESRPTFLELGKTLHRLMTAQKVSIIEARERYKIRGLTVKMKKYCSKMMKTSKKADRPAPNKRLVSDKRPS